MPTLLEDLEDTLQKKSHTWPLGFAFPERGIIFIFLLKFKFLRTVGFLGIKQKSNQVIIFIPHDTYVYFWWCLSHHMTELLYVVCQLSSYQNESSAGKVCTTFWKLTAYEQHFFECLKSCGNICSTFKCIIWWNLCSTMGSVEFEG